MAKTDGGPAFFPTMKHWRWGEREEGESEGGASLRDYFAGQALVGFAANPRNMVPDDGDAMGIARAAYLLADAMLRARNREDEQHGE